MSFTVALFVLFFSSGLHCIPVPNGQLGNVEVECGEDTIEAVFLTEAIFQGRIFVIGHANDPSCISRDVGRRTTSIVINKKQCGVVTTRSTDPNGLFSTVKIMISFHTDFVTKVDRGYEISCFYMVADKTVTYPLTVATQEVPILNELAEMPRCRYEVIDPTTREQAEIITVGSKLLHQWTCTSTAPDHWCMTVHSCNVEDGAGTHFQILDETGCSVDKYILDNLEYTPGQLHVQKEAHAFKFADKIVVNFQCSIKLDIKDGDCPIPVCKDSSTTKAKSGGFRGKRSSPSVRELNATSLDVTVQASQIDVIDLQSDFGSEERNDISVFINRRRTSDCIPRQLVFVVTTILTVVIIVLSSIVLVLFRRKATSSHSF